MPDNLPSRRSDIVALLLLIAFAVACAGELALLMGLFGKRPFG